MAELSAPEVYSQPVEHPRQPGWYQAMTAKYPENGIHTLEQRLTSLNAAEREQAIGAVVTSTFNRELTRQLNDVEGVAYLMLDADEKDDYQEMAGNAEQIGSLLTWLATNAASAFGRQSDIYKPGYFKIGLDLGGKRLLGKVEGTQSVNNMIAAIPAQLQQQEQKANIVSPDTIRDRTTRYRLEARRYKGNDLVFGTITRRKGIMDLIIETGHRKIPQIDIELFESFTGLIIVDQVPTAFRERLIREHANDQKRAQSAETDSRAANLAGRMFEKVIGDNHNMTTVITPIGMHIVAVARRERRAMRTS